MFFASYYGKEKKNISAEVACLKYEQTFVLYLNMHE